MAEVLGARAEELFTIVADILEDKNIAGLINGGFVVTGGGALIKGLPGACGVRDGKAR